MTNASYHTLHIQNINLDVLCSVVDTARSKTTDSRWLNAIEQAYDYLLTSEETITVYDDGTVIIPSATSNRRYRANGTCQCHAYAHGKAPCWHRAAARLIKRYEETLDTKSRAKGRRKALDDMAELFGYASYAEMEGAA